MPHSHHFRSAARSQNKARAKRKSRRASPRVFEQLELRQLLALTHLYTFNNNTAADSIGTAHGTLFGGASISEGWLNLQNGGTVTPKTSGDVTTQHVKLPNGILPASGSATIEVWYTTSSIVQNWARVFDFGDQVAGQGNSYLFFTAKSGTADARAVMRSAGGTERIATYAGGTNNGLAHLASVVVDSAAGQLRLYIDGNLASSAALSGTTIGNINEATAFLGRSLFDADPAFTGMIDEVRIYDEALSATTIAQHAASGATRAVPTTPARQIENLDRGIVAIRRSTNTMYVGWRLLATDPTNIAFNVYRSANGGAATKLNANPITLTTDFADNTVNTAVSNVYTVRAVIDGVEQAATDSFTVAANTPVRYFLEIPTPNPPPGGSLPGTSDTVAHTYTHTLNDLSVGDLDGDGEYEIIVKWEPTDAKDNSQDGYTGNVFFDAYKLDGTRLWRIDLGRNIRAGAHYTQFSVYDLDGDGKAEIAMKTAPGTIDGLGNAVLMGSDLVTADYRNSEGYILTGPEYFTVFNGLTGANMATVAYQPARVSVSQWGDGYGNRVDRFLSGVAYLDGARPSLIVGRGYYGPSGNGQARNEIAAYDFRNGQLTLRWHFKAGRNINNNININYIGQGAHSLTIGDVDNDGKDEVIWGAAAVDDNGAGLYSTGYGHGDALHMTDMDPTRAGQEVFMPHEGTGGNGNIGATLRDARTGAIIAALPVVQNTDGSWPDVGRGLAIDIDPRHLGYEFWDSYHGSIYNSKGQPIYNKPSNMHQNFAAWWDADLLRETLDGNTIADFNYTTLSRSNFDLDPNTSGTQSAPGTSSNNGTKATPGLSVDLFGDWREEVIFRKSDNTGLRIFTTPISATSRLPTLMHDIQYREAIAWQNTAYNQPPHTSFFLGDGMRSVPAANLYFAGGPSNMTLSAGSIAENQPSGTAVGNLTSTASGAASTYTYAFVSGAGSIDNGAFQIVGNQLRTSASFDFETKSSYSIRIRTTNANGLFYDEPFVITVSNVNETPTVATPATGSLNVAVTAATLGVLGADDASEAALTYTWSATGPAAVAYSANGTNAAKTSVATFTEAGNYTFTVTIKDAGNLTTTSVVVVSVNQLLSSIDVSPASANLFTTDTQQFSATALDQFADSLTTQPSLVWSLDAGSVGSIDSTGQYTAPISAGAATVRATSGSVSDTASVNVSWVKGDANGDGQRTLADLRDFLRAQIDLAAYQFSRNLSNADLIAILDTNSDNNVSNLDIQALLNLLATDASGSGSGSVVNEPAAPSPVQLALPPHGVPLALPVRTNAPVNSSPAAATVKVSTSTLKSQLPFVAIQPPPGIATVSKLAPAFQSKLADAVAARAAKLTATLLARDRYFNNYSADETRPLFPRSADFLLASRPTAADNPANPTFGATAEKLCVDDSLSTL